jgi:hypothetical protein
VLHVRHSAVVQQDLTAHIDREDVGVKGKHFLISDGFDDGRETGPRGSEDV